MRLLRSSGIPLGVIFLVVGLILGTIVPERRMVHLPIGCFGLILLAAGLVLNRHDVLAFLRGRRARAAGASAGYTITVIAVVVLINFLAGRHHSRLDTTESSVFSLSEQTISILKSLPGEVVISAFVQDGAPTKQRMEDLLDEYRYHSRRLSVRYIDPDKNPAEVRRYEVTGYGTIIVERDGHESRINSVDEESLTNALIKVTSDEKKIVYVTTGHGERDPEDSEEYGLSQVREALERQHYEVKSLHLNREVPRDASMVLLAGPRVDFLQEEIGVIRDYLGRGGRAFIVLDPGSEPGLAGVLSEFGLALRDDVVIDKVSQLFGGNAMVPMVSGYDALHPVTKTFRYQTFYQLAASVELLTPLPEGVSVTSLARTSEASWGESSREELESGHIAFTEEVDVMGPMTIGAAATRRYEEPVGDREEDPVEGEEGGDGVDTAAGEREPSSDESPEARVILFGDSDFLSNAYFNASGNGDLTLNAIAWLAEREELVSIRPKSSTPTLMILPPQKVVFYFVTIVAVIRPV